jgi:hypothetical protein
VLLKVADIIERVGAEIAFPTSTVHLEDSAELAISTGASSKV